MMRARRNRARARTSTRPSCGSAIALMLMLAYGASVGGLLTPVGSPPNLIGRGLIEEATGESIGFLEWVVRRAPDLRRSCSWCCASILLLLNKPEVKRLEGVEDYVAEERPSSARCRGPSATPSSPSSPPSCSGSRPASSGSSPGSSPRPTRPSRPPRRGRRRGPRGQPAVPPADQLVEARVHDHLDEAGIDWGTILLFGSGIVFGGLLHETGLAERIGTVHRRDVRRLRASRSRSSRSCSRS